MKNFNKYPYIRGCAFEPWAVLRRFRGISGIASNSEACEPITRMVFLSPVASDGITPTFP